MKILFVNDYWEYGGAERIVQALFNQAKLHGYEPVFDNKILDIMKMLRYDKFDIVHFHNISSIGTLPLEFCIKNRIPCLITIHDYWPICKNRKLLINEYSNMSICNNNDFGKCTSCDNNMGNLRSPESIVGLLNSAHMTTVSKYQADVIKRFDPYKGANIKVVRNGIDINNGWHNTGKYDYVFWFGINKKEKNIDAFNKINKQLGHKIPFISLATPSLVMKENRKSEEDIKNLYASCLLFIITSNWAEPNGLTQMQAQASGKAVVGFNVGGISEYLPNGICPDSDCGILVNVCDIQTLRQAVEKLIDNPDMANRMGENGRRNMTNNFTESIMWDNYYNVYQDIINKQ